MAYKGPRGSGFVGLQQYLGLNREAGERMGGALASQVEQQGQAAKSAIDAASGAFNEAAQRGTPQYDATSAALEPALLGQAAGQRRIAYTGPKQLGDVANVSDLTSQAARAEQTAQLAGSEPGRQVLLRQQYGRGTPYGQGASMLDAALAGRGGGARLQQASGGFGRLREYLGLAGNQATARAATGAGEAKALSDRYKTEAPAAPAYTAPAPLPPTSSTQVPEYLKPPEQPKKKRPWYDPIG